MKVLFASIQIPQSVINHCLERNVPLLDIPSIFEEYLMSLAGWAYYDDTEASPSDAFALWFENEFDDDYSTDDSDDEGPEYDSAGFTEEDRIINGQHMVVEKATREVTPPDFMTMAYVNNYKQSAAATTKPTKTTTREYNSYKSYVRTLELHGQPMSENMLNLLTFGYDRNIMSKESNKKYADMLRRAVNNGYIKRRCKPAGSKGKHHFEYYV